MRLKMECTRLKETTKTGKEGVRASFSRLADDERRKRENAGISPEERLLLTGLRRRRTESLHRAIVSDFDDDDNDNDSDGNSSVAGSLRDLDRNTSLMAMEYCYHVHETLVNRRPKKTMTAESLMDIDSHLVRRTADALLTLQNDNDINDNNHNNSFDNEDKRLCSTRFRYVVIEVF